MFTKDSFFVYSALSIVAFICNTYLYITWKQIDRYFLWGINE